MVLAVLVAAAVAAPQFGFGYGGLIPGYTAANTFSFGPAPVAYAGPAPVAYAAPVPAPVAYAAPVPVPAPVAYQTGATVVNRYQPVEQHGYQIAY